MKLWLLRARKDLPTSSDGYGVDNPWSPWYDKTFGFVVRAETEADARSIATENAGNEISHLNEGVGTAWLDAKYSTCVELTTDGEPGLIIEDHARA